MPQRKGRVRKAPSPTARDAVLFVDYENARGAARESYGRDNNVGVRDGHFDPVRLGLEIVNTYNRRGPRKEWSDPRSKLTLAEVRVYRGKPDSRYDPVEASEHERRTQVWRESASTSPLAPRLTIVEPLRQRAQEWYPTKHERTRSVEKEVDTQIAVDLIALAAHDDKPCVAILFSNDYDLLPAVNDLLDRYANGGQIEIHRAGWGKNFLRLEQKGRGGASYPHQMTAEHYTAIADQRPLTWDALALCRDNEDVLEGIAVAANRRGLRVGVNGAPCFLPAGSLQPVTDDLEERRKQLVGNAELRVLVKSVPSAEGGAKRSVPALREAQTDVTVPNLQKGDVLDGQVALVLECGVLVDFGEFTGFVPRRDALKDADLDVTEAFADRDSVKVLVDGINEKANHPRLSIWKAREIEQKDRLLDELHEGEIRAGRITSIRPFGVFVDLGGADGLAHLSELSWERDIDSEQMFTIGQQVSVFITKIDKESKKIGLSIRRASPEQWDEVVAKFEVGQIVPSVVTKLVTFGAFARLEGPVEGLVHVSELADRRINHPREVVTEGDIVPARIVRIERDRHRLGLSLRQARSDAERAGWRFDSEGRIVRLPDAVAEQFGVEQDRL